jgi:F0F1-type ATP synthase membrane subunit c/vacuolar-type H+-ATPase subunit K
MFRKFSFTFLLTLLFAAVATVAFAEEGAAAGMGDSSRTFMPKIFIPMIVGLALIESLVIYALVIAFILVGKM